MASDTGNSQNSGGIYLVEVRHGLDEDGFDTTYFLETTRAQTTREAVVDDILPGQIEDVLRVVWFCTELGISRDASVEIAELVANRALGEERILPHELIDWLSNLVPLSFRERVYLRGEPYEEAVANERADHIVSLRKSEAA